MRFNFSVLCDAFSSCRGSQRNSCAAHARQFTPICTDTLENSIKCPHIHKIVSYSPTDGRKGERNGKWSLCNCICDETALIMSFSNACEFVNTVYGNEKNGKKGEDMRKSILLISKCGRRYRWRERSPPALGCCSHWTRERLSSLSASKIWAVDRPFINTNFCHVHVKHTHKHTKRRLAHCFTQWSRFVFTKINKRAKP